MSICESNWDTARYEGDEEDGCYINVAEGNDGFYTTVSVDCNTSSFTENLMTDDGPYESFDIAEQVGLNYATNWCLDNEVHIL